MLTPGTLAPHFALFDQNGETHELSAYRGRKVVLYFYPKDDTPGCTKEACAIADVYGDFERLGVTVFGVSADSPESHRAFAEKYSLPFTLLSDPERAVIKAYGAYQETDPSGSGIHTRRVTYLIDEEGNIAKAYPEVDPATHALEILKDLAAGT